MSSKLLPPELLGSYRRKLAKADIPPARHSYYLRWLKLYRSDCLNGNLNPDSPAHLDLFLAGIRQRQSSAFLIAQARHAVELAFEAPGGETAPTCHEPGPAAPCSGSLMRESMQKEQGSDGSACPERQLMRIAARVKARRQRSIENLIADGQDLRRAKALLPHGRFTDWLGREFDLSYVSALRMMQAAEAFGDKITIVKDLSRRALYELAAPGTPARIRAGVLAGLEAGETFSYARIKRLKEAEPPSRTSRPERSLSRGLGELAQRMARLTRRTRRQLGHFRLQFDADEHRQIEALHEQLKALESLLQELRAYGSGPVAD